MPRIEGDIPSQVSHPDRRVFEKGLKAFHRWREQCDDGGVFGMLRSVLDALDGADLGTSDLSGRARILLQDSRPEESDLALLAAHARHLKSELKNAVLAHLPPHLRRRVYAEEGAAVTEESTSPPPRAPEARQEPPAAACEVADASGDPTGSRTVLLLGVHSDHEGNRAILTTHNLSPLRVTTLDALERLLSQDACGVVVSRSWWASIPGDRHQDCLEKLIRHSSFAWFKLDLNGFQGQISDLRLTIRTIRFEDPSAFELSVGDGCQITPAEIPSIQKASELLSSPARVRLCPDDIKENQVRVLLGAASKHVDGRNMSGCLHLTKVAMKPIFGGRSAARIVRIEPNDGGAPLVAKIHEMAYLEDEMRRFREFVGPWDTALSPRIHYHAGTALIMFARVDAPGSPGYPAPTLEDRLDNETLEVALGRGMLWKIPDIDGGECDPFALRTMAVETIEPRRRLAVVPGDVHLRNVLVRDDLDPCFSDYAFRAFGRNEKSGLFSAVSVISSERS